MKNKNTIQKKKETIEACEYFNVTKTRKIHYDIANNKEKKINREEKKNQ